MEPPSRRSYVASICRFVLPTGDSFPILLVWMLRISGHVKELWTLIRVEGEVREGGRLRGRNVRDGNKWY